MKYSNKEMIFMLERINKRLFDLNDWEQTFIGNVGPKIVRGIELTNSQAEKFSHIWDKLEEV